MVSGPLQAVQIIKWGYRQTRLAPYANRYMPKMSKPLLLDLYCGAGGVAVGYHRAGFQVVGGVTFRAWNGAGVDDLLIVLVGVHNPAQAELLDVAQAHGPFALLAGPLQGRHQNRHQHRNHGDHDQKLN